MSTQRNTRNNISNSTGPVAPNDPPVAAGTQVLTPPAAAPAPPVDLQGTQTYDEAQRAVDSGDFKGPDRRAGARTDRRLLDMGSPTGLERRRGPGLRRTDDRRSAEEGEMTDEQFEFILAFDTYKRINNRPFPTWTEILEVVKQLGYRKVAASTLSLTGAVSRSSTQAQPAPRAEADHSNQPETD